VFEFKLPDLGEGVHEGELLHWHVKPGDRVGQDDPLVEVETDKAAVTIPSPKAGTVVSVNGGVGDTIAVGSVLVVIEDADGVQRPATPVQVAAEAPRPAPAVVPATRQPAPPRKSTASAAPAPAPAMRPLAREGPRGMTAAAPATRRRARELGVPLAQVPGSGPGGRVTAEDVRRFAETSTIGLPPQEAAATAPIARVEAEPRADGVVAKTGETVGTSSAAARSAVADAVGRDVAARRDAMSVGSATGIPFFGLDAPPDFAQWGPIESEPIRSIRRKVAQKMVTSMTVVPHVAHMDEADVTALDAFRRESNAQRDDGVKLTLLAFVMRAAVAQLRQAPQFNASIDPVAQEIVYKKYYNVGFAADTPRGLVVPVVEGADRMSIVEIGAAIAQLAEKARNGTLDVSEMRGGTFTVTNVGSLGGTAVIPTINYPEAAILGLGKAADKPVVRNGEIVVRKMLPMTLAFDHRLIDGADAARFVTGLVGKLSDPNRLLLEC